MANAQPFTPAVEDFEDVGALDRWIANDGIWEIGTPTSGPGAAHSGTKCLATVLGGNYPENESSRVVGPTFTVPAADQDPRLRFWQWFSFGSGDSGKAQLSLDNGTTWVDLPAQVTTNGSGGWALSGCSLRAYAGQSVTLGFYFVSSSPGGFNVVAPGWYIDEITVATGVRSLPAFEDFEDTAAAVDRWVTDGNNNIWEIGAPTSGPGVAHSGANVMATKLAGNYVDGTSARAMSPKVTVPLAGQSPILRYWQWFTFGSGDFGQVQISTDDGATWQNLSAQIAGTGASWTRSGYSLSAYAGQDVRIGFLFSSSQLGGFNVAGPGWYIDEVVITTSGPQPPTVTTLPPTNVTQTSADLQASVNPNGQSTTAYFEYGTEPTLNPALATVLTTSPPTDVGSGSAAMPVTKTVTGLSPGVTYYVRAVAINNAASPQTGNGAIVAFHQPPTVMTSAAAGITGNAATLKGSVNPNGLLTTYQFEWAPTSTGSPTPLSSAGSGTAPTTYSFDLTQLAPNTLYSYKIVASNIAGSAMGVQQTFTTATLPPTVTTLAAQERTGTTAILRGTVNPNNANTTYYFEYGPTMSYGTRTNVALAGSGNAPVPVSTQIMGLTPGITYHYRLVASNAGSGANGTPGADVLTPALAFHLPDAEDLTPLSLRVDTPGFRWRIQGTTAWLDDGIDAQKRLVATGVLGSLTPGEAVIEFEARTGLRVPGPRAIVLDPQEAQGGEVLRTIEAVTGADGGLSVAIEPAAVAGNPTAEERGQWRLRGESEDQWRDGGQAASTLAPGVYEIEFKVVPFKVPIPPRTIQVLPGTVTTLRAFYEQVRDQANGAAAPELVPLADVAATAPYCFAGQFQSDVGFGSGMVVDERVVLTAAHVVFDDVTLTYSTGLHWRFQREHGVSDPVPLTPRGSYVFDNYAALRRAEVPNDGVGVARQSSQQRDVAAVFFQAHAAGRHGFTAVLKTDQANDWLTQARQKTMVTYPIDPGFLKAPSFSSADAGKMFRTPPQDAAFTLVAPENAASAPSRVYATTALAGYPGGSGGAVCVQFDDGQFYPAGIYLGGDGKAIVRAIDDDVMNLVANAQLSAEDDSNNTGGGSVRVNSSVSAGSFSISTVKVNLTPGAISADAGWRLDAETAFRASGARASAAARTHVITFKPVPGYEAPAPYTFTLAADQALTLTAEYSVKKRPQFLTTVLPEGITGLPYRPFQIVAANAPTTFSATGLPPAMTLSAKGVISGTPQVAGLFSVTITASNSTGATSRIYSLLVREQGSLAVHFSATEGSVTGIPATIGQGRPVTLVAKPKAGFIFSRWSGIGLANLPTASPRLAFTMTEVVDVTAEFIRNPFPAVAGTYRGLLIPDTAGLPSLPASGVAQITITAAGSYSGSVTVGTSVAPFKGQLAADLSARVRFKTAGGMSECGLQLALDTSHTISPATLHLLSGDLVVAPLNTPFHFTARRSLSTLLAKRFTIELPPDANHPELAYPQGSSVATVTIGKSGTLTAQFLLADGTRVTAGGFLTEPAVSGSTAQWTLYQDLYAHQGLLAGDLSFGVPASADVSGDVRWFRNGAAVAAPFANGWPSDGLLAHTAGYGFSPPRAPKGADAGQLPLNGLDVTKGVTLNLGSAGVLAAPEIFTRGVSLSRAGVFSVSLPNAEKLQLTATPASGLFTGKFTAADGSVRSFAGILQQAQDRGAGYVVGGAGAAARSAGVTLGLAP